VTKKTELAELSNCAKATQAFGVVAIWKQIFNETAQYPEALLFTAVHEHRSHYEVHGLAVADLFVPNLG